MNSAGLFIAATACIAAVRFLTFFVAPWVKAGCRQARRWTDQRRAEGSPRQERDILAKAAAWFVRESKASPNGFTGS
jgi:hypothetical protein